VAGFVVWLAGCGDSSALPGAEGTEAGGASAATAESGATGAATAAATSAGTEPSPGSTTGEDDTVGPDSTAGADTTSGDTLVAHDDALHTRQDQPLATDAAGGVFVNDTTPMGPLVLVSADASSTHGGAVAVADDGATTYTPPAGFWGPDSFEYTVRDATGTTASATATVFVAPVNIALAEVADGNGGFAIDGEMDQDDAGIGVGGAGDVNGDGLDDVIIGARNSGFSGIGAGRGYVVFGKGDTTSVMLSSLGLGGFALDSGEVGPAVATGNSVDGAGDFDGDGLADVIIGAHQARVDSEYTGQAFVVFGTADTAAVSLGSLGSAGVSAAGSPGDLAGWAVRGAGDVDGDGLADVVIGGLHGPVYVVFGDPNPGDLALGSLGLRGFAIHPEAAADALGRGVDGAGDVNGDGRDDLIVGALDADYNGSNAGRSYVVFGKADSADVDLATLGSAGFVIDGAHATALCGWSVAGGGDINGDGLDDLVVGAPGYDPQNPSLGQIYAVFGKADSGVVDLGALGGGGFAIVGASGDEHLGMAVSGAGDISGDGLADIVVGASRADASGVDSGSVYVVFGKPDAGTIELDAIDATVGFQLDGEAAGDLAGDAVGGAGDVDGDGISDVVIGARRASPNGVQSGRTYVVFGVPTGP
jgi:hypothetical protein